MTRWSRRSLPLTTSSRRRNTSKPAFLWRSCEEGEGSLEIRPAQAGRALWPRDREEAHAVVQLRREDRRAHVEHGGLPDEAHLPGAAEGVPPDPRSSNAEFLRYGSVHRNTFVNTPGVLTEFFQPKKPGWRVSSSRPDHRCRGYVESIASGLIAGINISRSSRKRSPCCPSDHHDGALFSHIAHAARSASSR